MRQVQVPAAQRDTTHVSPSRAQTRDRNRMRALQVVSFLTIGAAVLLLPVQAMVLFVLLTATAASIAVYNTWLAHHRLEPRRRRALNHMVSEIAFAVVATGLVAATIFPAATMAACFSFAVAVFGLWSVIGAAKWLGLMQPVGQGATAPAAQPGRARDTRKSGTRSAGHGRARSRTAA